MMLKIQFYPVIADKTRIVYLHGINKTFSLFDRMYLKKVEDYIGENVKITSKMSKVVLIISPHLKTSETQFTAIG